MFAVEPIRRLNFATGSSVLGMTRRKDSITAERLSIALLTRAAFGTQAGLRSALFYGIRATLTKEVFSRPSSRVRIQVAGSHSLTDRRQHMRATEI